MDQKTNRQRIISILTSGKADVTHLSIRLSLKEKEVLTHLEHVRKSSHGFKIEPAKCLCCSFVFEDRTKLSVPSRCPKCRSERVCKPIFYIEVKDDRRNHKKRTAKSS